ncbi:MAG: TMEM165/GDT1 family protein [Desulfobaccales bacterium]
MNWKIFWITFGTIFLAEMGDKTQLAALTLVADTRLPLSVLAGACAAFFLAILLTITVGSTMAHLLPEGILKKLAGTIFIVSGGLILWGKL